MSTLEDKLLGDDKLENYCSCTESEGSSDDEDSQSGDEDSRSGNEEGSLKSAAASVKQPSINSWSGSASNTGPKGVLEDWRRYKQLEIEHRKEMERQRIALAKKLTMSVNTEQEDAEAKEMEEMEIELNELIDEDFLLKYQQQRKQELMAQFQNMPKFGKVVSLETKEDFLNAIDKEDPNVTIIVHIYDKNVNACDAMDGCINILAPEYTGIKFCRISADTAGLSAHFRTDGVPALLTYKGGQIIGNFVQMINELGNDFYVGDVQKFLSGYGMLPEN